MAARAAHLAEQLAHHLTGVVAADAMITHGNYQVTLELARDDGPLHALELKTEVSHLHDHIVALDAPEMEQRNAVVDLETLHHTRQHAGEAGRQFRPVDLP